MEYSKRVNVREQQQRWMKESERLKNIYIFLNKSGGGGYEKRPQDATLVIRNYTSPSFTSPSPPPHPLSDCLLRALKEGSEAGRQLQINFLLKHL